MQPIVLQLLGALLAFSGVGLGAFGAHALKARLDEHALTIWHTGVDYQIWHALGLLLVGLILERHSSGRWIPIAGRCLFAGTLLFSGSLYLLALTQIRGLGMITPIGGSLLLVGWLCLFFGLLLEATKASKST